MKKLKSMHFFLILLALACFLIGGKALAQTTLVTLEGVVTDEEGSPLPGATVLVKSMETGYELHTSTRSDGSYIVSGIQPGKYEVEISLPGFGAKKRSGLTLAVGAKVSFLFK